ncbi:MAG: RNA-binding protein [Clostridia bacterium]|nr:MAG: RNA-binding protein [Clostridia bacterium]
MELRAGQLVFSQAGRDQGQAYLIWRLIDNRFVEVVDGYRRRVERPKRKNVRHVRPTSQTALTVAQKLERGEPVSNAEVRKAIDQLGAGKGGGPRDG